MTALLYELKLDKYSGPLEKLLELIEDKKLSVSEISLAQVTEDFLAYLRELEAVQAPLLADFISVASKLLLIKSKSLLPDFELTREEEEEIKELEGRLALYKELKPSMKILAQSWQLKNEEYSRPYFLDAPLATGNASQQIFYPGRELSLQSLTQSLGKVFETLSNYELENKVIKDKIVSLEEKMKEILARLQGGVEMSFGKLSYQRSGAEIIAMFLAILHLAHDRSISLEQGDHFSDIMIKKIEPDLNEEPHGN